MKLKRRNKSWTTEEYQQVLFDIIVGLQTLEKQTDRKTSR